MYIHCHRNLFTEQLPSNIPGIADMFTSRYQATHVPPHNHYIATAVCATILEGVLLLGKGSVDVIHCTMTSSTSWLCSFYAWIPNCVHYSTTDFHCLQLYLCFSMSWHVKRDRCSWGPNQWFNQFLAEKNNFLVVPHICGREGCLNSYATFPWNTFLSAVVQKVSQSGQFTDSECKRNSLCREAGVTVRSENHLRNISALYPPCILVHYILV
jgi:hypothetical protein